MPHVILLGDSIFDNADYTDGGPDVVAQLRQCLPPGWQATLAAIDGSTTDDIAPQLAALPADATHLVLSVGGNDAMLRADLLDTPVPSSAAALDLLAEAARAFDADYRQAVAACLALGLPLSVCTVYNGYAPESRQQQRAMVALAVFNDVILRTAVQNNLTVIELRLVCTTAADYANPIEPSCQGGAKIAAAITQALLKPARASHGAWVVAGGPT